MDTWPQYVQQIHQKHESTTKGSETSSDADKMTAKTHKKITVTKRQLNGTDAK